VIEVQKEIDLKKAVLENYLSDATKRASMDASVKKIPNNLVTKNLVAGETFTLDVNKTVSSSNRVVTETGFIKDDKTNAAFRSFTLLALEPFFKPTNTLEFENFITSKNSTTNIRVIFKDINNQVVHTTNATFDQIPSINNPNPLPIPLFKTVVASQYEIRISMQGLIDPGNVFTRESFTIKEISFFQEAATVQFYE
jgi:hypothetical protein